MNRRQILLLITTVALLASWNGAASVLRAQQRPAQAGARPRGNLQAPQMMVEKLPPRLEQILQEWAATSANIKKLEGKHRRWVYDKVFNVSKRSHGVFYYEAPDKGRIDIYEDKQVKPGQQVKYPSKNGKIYAVKSDQPEMWICNGQEIVQLDPKQKQGDRIPIPQGNQGANIMDGPLPFLFGMPPEQAKKRYKMELISENADGILLNVKPRWRSDAVNYRQATLKLAKPSYLPVAVRLVDPAGNLETNYAFSGLKVNKPRTLWDGFKDPFETNLRGYKIRMNNPAQAQQQQQPRKQQQPRPLQPQAPPQQLANQGVPNFTGKGWNKIEPLLVKRGYKQSDVQLIEGKAPPAKNLQWLCYTQDPAPNAPRKPGQKLRLVFYAKFQDAAPRRR